MMNKIILIIFFLFVSISFVQSQEEEFPGGSPYTIFGIGDLYYPTSLRTEAMGVQGIGLYGNYINNLNIAANTRLQSTAIILSGRYDFLKSSDGSKEFKSADGNISGINIGIPFNRNNGWVMNLGFNPYSEVNYRITRTGSIGGENYSQIYAGEGGLSRLNAGMTYIILKSVSVGFEYNFTFGNIVTQDEVQFTNTLLTDAFIRKETELKGSMFKGGLVFDMNKLTKNNALRNFALGIVYSSQVNLTTSTEAIYKTSVSTDSTSIGTSEIKIPQQFGIGLSNRVGQVQVAADFLMQNWEEYTEAGNTIPELSNSYRLGLGVEIQPGPGQDKSLLQKLTYRIGGYYQKDHYTINSQSVNRIGGSLGFGIPITEFNSLDLAFNYYTRGETGNGLIKDDVFSISAGFNFGELWFIRPNDEDR